MIEEKALTYFNNFPDLKILFFFDEQKEFLEEVQKLSTNVFKVVYWENNPFVLKYQLTQEMQHEKIFLYVPLAQPNTQEAYHAFPLMGLLLANKELQLDNVGTFMEEFGLQRNQKRLVSKYIKELKYSSVQNICKPVLTSGSFQEKDLQRALLSAFLKFKKTENWYSIITKLGIWSQEEYQEQFKTVENKIKANGLEEILLEQINKYTNLYATEFCKTICRQAICSLWYNYTTQNSNLAKEDPYQKLKINDATSIIKTNQWWQEIENNESLEKPFKTLLLHLDKDIQSQQLVKCYGVETKFQYYTPQLVWEVLKVITLQLNTQTSEVLEIINRLSLQQEIKNTERQTIVWLRHVLKFSQEIQQIESYHYNNTEDYIHAYTETGYKIDSLYRKSILAYKKIDLAEVPKSVATEDIFRTVNETYQKHIDLQNRTWLQSLNQIHFDYKELKVPKQYDFYKNEVATVNQKLVVIISDALRYEAAVDLLAIMHGDSKNTAEIKYQLASIPSKTNIGMAQLLPGIKSFNNGEVLSDDLSTSGTDNRTKILQAYKEKAIAIQYTEVDSLSQKEARELFKNNLVYIYHDVIDATGDKRVSERRTFEAVESAKDELAKFVKMLHSSYNVTNVLITADHGFLYTDEKIEDKALEALPKNILSSHNRFFITEEDHNQELGYTFPLKLTTAFDDEVYVTTPFSVNRYRKSGVGHQFVHGGASLQELVTPVIVSSRKRVEFAKKVMPTILNKGKLSIVSNVLKFNILQENEISKLEKERSVRVALYKDNQLVSNEIILELNKVSESPSERLFNVLLIITAVAAETNMLKLKVFDVEDELNPLIEEWVQNNTSIAQDF
ncbi:BREX-1 system phosphatase PglZ type A [Wenyingzhuangia marina]|uniref:TIGR02687 family protein n=1 Tax=Wenyingzhuangia marina TaxID=1195760 RepID=A0A1M5S765_9FLAO|nr:BREX-1 system phosphatase PglZ type A [Wenyingzhuangia marina]GGF79087.1 DNA repair protein [Wenyingzhuangia marina]SHH34128.1 TIGR02687 family protein [Wenyingzhuangia marina]